MCGKLYSIFLFFLIKSHTIRWSYLLETMQPSICVTLTNNDLIGSWTGTQTWDLQPVCHLDYHPLTHMTNFGSSLSKSKDSQIGCSSCCILLIFQFCFLFNIKMIKQKKIFFFLSIQGIIIWPIQDDRMNWTEPWQWRTLTIEFDHNWNQQTFTLRPGSS